MRARTGITMCIIGLVLFVFTMVGCSSSDKPPPGQPTYQALIQWTSYGIPHITAADWAGAGYGNGYAFAKMNACTLADQIIKVRGERSMYFGPDSVPGSGNQENALYDFFYKGMDMEQWAQDWYDRLSDESKTTIRGYVAGYNRFLREADPDDLNCSGEWVGPISVLDYAAVMVDFSWLGNYRPLMGAIVNAQPPAGITQLSVPEHLKIDPHDIMGSIQAKIGSSNAWGIGADNTVDGSTMLLGNPHYPWVGEKRFFESHTIIPNVVNIYGSTLYGLAMPGIAFNENVAWTHTVCTSSHFTFYRLQLVPGNPTAYYYDDEEVEMETRTVTIDIRLPDDSLIQMSRTFYFSHYGPMVAIPGALEWTSEAAWAIHSATDHDNGGEMRKAMARAESIEELKQAIADWQSVNYLNVIAVDRHGTALYVDAGNVPNITQDMLDAGCALNLGAGPNPMYLDGSRSECEWYDDPAAAQPGIVPFYQAPQLETTAYVANSNNSYWLTNPDDPIEMTIPNQLWGREGTDIGLRPRMGLTMMVDESGDDGLWSWEEFQSVLFNNRVMGGELLADDLAQLCLGQTENPQDVIDACTALTGWDTTYNLDSSGGHVFRQFMKHCNDAPACIGSLWAVPFDPDDPVNTPHTLNTDNADAIMAALIAGIGDLIEAGIPFDALLGDIQFTRKGDTVIPIHGGPHADGTFNMLYYNDNNTKMNDTLLPTDITLGGLPSGSLADQQGYLINYGSSWMMMVNYLTDGTLQAKALTSYSQTKNRNSPHNTDQTLLFSQSQWRDILFAADAIDDDPNLIEEIISE